MNTEFNKKHVLLKMSVFSLSLCLLMNAGIHYYLADIYSGWVEIRAKVVEIQTVKNEGTSKAGYSVLLRLEIFQNQLPELKGQQIDERFGLNTPKRHQFSSTTSAGQVISLWFNRGARDFEIVQPTRPEFFDKFPLILGTAGIVFMIIGMFLFGEMVQRK